MCGVKPDFKNIAIAGGAAIGAMGAINGFGGVLENGASSKLGPWMKPLLAGATFAGTVFLSYAIDEKSKHADLFGAAIAGALIGSIAYGVPRIMAAMDWPDLARVTGQLGGPPPAQAEIKDPRQMLALAWALADGEERREMLQALRDEERGALPMPEDNYPQMHGDVNYRATKAAELDELLNGDPGDYYYDYYDAA